MERHDQRTPSLVVDRIELLQTAGDRVHLRLCLLEIDSRLQTRDDDRVVFSAHRALFIRPPHRHPHLGELGKAKTLGHHSGDLKVLPVHCDIAADNSAIRAEMLLPKPVTEHENVGTSWLVFLWDKAATEHRRYSQRLEEAGADSTGSHLL